MFIYKITVKTFGTDFNFYFYQKYAESRFIQLYMFKINKK